MLPHQFSDRIFIGAVACLVQQLNALLGMDPMPFSGAGPGYTIDFSIKIKAVVLAKPPHKIAYFGFERISFILPVLAVFIQDPEISKPVCTRAQTHKRPFLIFLASAESQ